MSPDPFARISRDTQLRRVSSRAGGEYAGPCPLCREGNDRFHHRQGQSPRGIAGDAPGYLQRRDGISYADACAARGLERHVRSRPLPQLPPGAGRAPFAVAQPPTPAWQQRGRAFVARTQLRLWRQEGGKAQACLPGRGLSDDTIRAAGLGRQPQKEREPPSLRRQEPQRAARTAATSDEMARRAE